MRLRQVGPGRYTVLWYITLLLLCGRSIDGQGCFVCICAHTLYAVFANPVLPPSSLIPPFLLVDPKMPSASLGIRFCQGWWTLVRLNQSNSRTARTAQPPVMVMCAACTSGAQRTSCATRINCSLIFQTNDSRTMFCVAAMVRPLPNCAVC
jgi:hypothetical protein